MIFQKNTSNNVDIFHQYIFKIDVMLIFYNISILINTYLTPNKLSISCKYTSTLITNHHHLTHLAEFFFPFFLLDLGEK